MADILVFLLVLSVLVGVHELGHFLAAKACGIYVDRFSIGMPPRIFGFQWGETDYCIGALPIGGYVKMAGQEDAPLSDEEREREYGHVPSHRWFNNKPVWQRSIVLLAGPAMNVVLAVVLYAIVAGVGSDVPEFEVSARIGQVVEDSPAESAPLWRVGENGAVDFTQPPDATGLITGDTITVIDGREVDDMKDLVFAAVLEGQDAEHMMLIERENAAGEVEQYMTRITPKLLDENAEFPSFGVSSFMTPVVGEVLPGMPAEAAGIREDDVILRADGEIVDQMSFVKKVEELPEGESLTLDILRDGEKIQLELQPRTVGRLTELAVGSSEPRSDAPEEAAPVILSVEEEFRKETGIQPKDVITEVNGEPATLKKLQDAAMASPGGVLTLAVERPRVLFGLLQRGETLNIELPVEDVRAIGVVHTPRMVFHRVPINEVLPEAFYQSYLAIERTVLTLKALFARDVSPTQLGGPVMIFQMTTKAAEEGWSWLFNISAFISVNLAVFNLLPLPVLDGGQLVVNAVEAIRRKPLNPVFLERFQQVGLLLIITLMLFVTWNDIGRWIQDLTP